MSIGQIITDIGAGLAELVPVFFGAIWKGFATLFLTYSEAEGVMTVTGFNALGSLSLVFLILVIVYKLVPAVTGFIGKRVTVGGKGGKRAKKKA